MRRSRTWCCARTLEAQHCFRRVLGASKGLCDAATLGLLVPRGIHLTVMVAGINSRAIRFGHAGAIASASHLGHNPHQVWQCHSRGTDTTTHG